LDEITADPEAMEALEEIVKEARSKSWGSHEGGNIIQIDTFKRRKPKVDPRAIIHRHVSNFMFSNRGEYHYTWTRRNRRGFTIPGKRRAEDEVLVFLDVSGSTFDQRTLSKFFNEIDYLASRGINIRLLTFDTRIREDLKYRQRLWRSRKFKGGGGTFAQPIFNWLRDKGKVKSPVLIFTDGVFLWEGLQSYGTQPFWVFSEDPFDNPHMKLMSEFGSGNRDPVPFGKSVVLEEE
jgi:predicted metal-dependent peptidase